MTDANTDQQNDGKEDFLSAAQEEERGLISEFVMFMAENKMWWMTPILVVFGLLGVLLVARCHRRCAVHLLAVLAAR